MKVDDHLDSGLVARLFRARNIALALTLLVACTFVYIFIDSQTSLPNYSLRGAAYDLLKDAAAGVAVILIGYLVAIVFLARDKEILSHNEIGRIAASVAGRVQEAVRRPLDETLLLRTDARELLQDATTRVYISRETGAVFFNECQSELQKLLKEGCRIDVVLTQPASIGAKNAEFRYSYSNKVFDHRTQTSKKLLKKVYQSSQVARKNLVVRYSSFALPSTVLIADPNTGRAKAIYRQIGHLTEKDEERLTLVLNAIMSPRTTQIITTEFEKTFYTSSKVAIISGKDGVSVSDLCVLFPEFFGTPFATESQSHDIGPVEAPDLFYIVVFERGELGSSSVLFGDGNSKAGRCQYALPGAGDNPKISLDNLREIRRGLEAAIDRKQAIVIANINQLALALPDYVERHQVVGTDLSHGPAENVKFFEEHSDPSTGVLPLSVVPAIERAIKSTDAHVYLHFDDAQAVQASAFYRAVETDIRSGCVNRDSLMRELLGTANAIRYTRPE